MRAVHPIAEQRIGTFVETVRRRFPGLLDSVIVTGSAASEDWHDGRSDIDLIMVVWRRLSESDAAILAELHAEASEPTPLDAMYLTTDQFADGPAGIAAAPQVIDGALALDAPGGRLTWVTWLDAEGAPRAEVSSEGMGPWQPAPIVTRDVAARAAEASRMNLVEYWQPLGREALLRSLPHAPSRPVSPEAVAWVVLGPPRLVLTIERGAIATKSEAGEFAAAQWPEFAQLIERVLAWRSTGTGEFTTRDARKALGLLRRSVARGTRKPSGTG